MQLWCSGNIGACQASVASSNLASCSIKTDSAILKQVENLGFFYLSCLFIFLSCDIAALLTAIFFYSLIFYKKYIIIYIENKKRR